MHRYGHLFSMFKAFRNTQGHLWTLLRLSHGENRGSSPLGSASYFNGLDECALRRISLIDVCSGGNTFTSVSECPGILEGIG